MEAKWHMQITDHSIAKAMLLCKKQAQFTREWNHSAHCRISNAMCVVMGAQIGGSA